VPAVPDAHRLGNDALLRGVRGLSALSSRRGDRRSDRTLLFSHERALLPLGVEHLERVERGERGVMLPSRCTDLCRDSGGIDSARDKVLELTCSVLSCSPGLVRHALLALLTDFATHGTLPRLLRVDEVLDEFQFFR